MWTRCSEWPMERYISRSNWECSAVNEEKEIHSGMELYWKGVVHHAHAVLQEGGMQRVLSDASMV